MIICGIKLTHDGAIALIDNGKLIFCYEAEKINNNERFADLSDFNLEYVASILQKNGYSMQDVDQFVIDGWGDFNHMSSDNDYPEFSLDLPQLADTNRRLRLAGYGAFITGEDVLARQAYEYPEIPLHYSSYLHVSGHILGAYCTSPFPARAQDSFALVWDGGMSPQLFYVQYRSGEIINLGSLFSLSGGIYSAFASNFKPFNHYAFDDPSIAGKLMAYISKGNCIPEVLHKFKAIFNEREEKIHLLKEKGIHAVKRNTTLFLQDILLFGELNDISGDDMMTTFHFFLQEILVEHLSRAVKDHAEMEKNLCYAGGCALNIKWNSAIRSTELFREMWVPPFPNDSGSAIGAACCEMFVHKGKQSLDWNVYAGPSLQDTIVNAHSEKWTAKQCSIKELARTLHLTGEPVVFLNGRAELGPRALGNRSILAAPVQGMKEILNRVKNRESYRPVAPICMEEYAPDIFSPGSPDPLMLYNHDVKADWLEKIPAVCHIDGTARLQTVTATQNPVIYELLTEYQLLSGIPLLCNTSANLNGKGFFPDVDSAMAWGKADFIWSGGILYAKIKSAKEIHDGTLAV
jgi:carbamoyltransferase